MTDDELLQTMIARAEQSLGAQDRPELTMQRVGNLLEAVLAEVKVETDRRKAHDATTKAALARLELRVRKLEDKP